MEKYVVWLYFRMSNIVDKDEERKLILTKKEYIMFTGIISRPKTKKTVFLRLTNP